MAELKLYKGEYPLWHFVPNKVAAVIFTILFVLITAALMFRMIRTRTWFCSVFIIGGFFEIIGFAARADAEDKTDELMPYIIQNTFILLAPALFAASVYMVLGRIIRRLHAEAHSIVPVRWLTKIFVLGDVVSFLVQGGAAGMMADQEKAELGQNIVIAGLFIQIVVFGFFIVTTFVFHKRVRGSPTLESSDPCSSWEHDLYMLYSVSILIMIRSVFRVVEFIMGYDGYLLRHEWPLYVFDAALMFGAMVIFFIRYPGGKEVSLDKHASIPLQSSS